MKHSKILFISIYFSYLSLISQKLSWAASACSVNGKEVSCDQLWDQYGGLFVGLGILIPVFLILGLLSTIFWVWMIIDCATRDFKDKVLWMIILLFTGIVGAILYFFLIKRKK